MDYTPLFLSLKVASIATIIVFILGTFGARAIAREDFLGKSVLEAIILLPLVLPPTVVGFALLYLFGKNGIFGKLLFESTNIQIVFTLFGAILAAIVVAFPLMYQSASAAFQNYDKNIENAAIIMGASKFKVFWTISFPLAWPGLLAGVVLTFARSLGEFGATLMIAGFIPGRTNTIPVEIYFAVQAGNTSTASFWVVILIVLGLVANIWLNWWSKRNLLKYKTD
ncbi:MULTISPECIES: molybdate ABC transporter permease subunit [Bacillaceae]|uniref:molybdate ABC transporter permease subunit n=1 Tax=Bacillaceae TaxID=186817 RepID=UPI0004E0FD2D|nr:MULTISPECIES: molybdate ABC transporter permease subunit [Bacillaceae]MCM3362925.1 molybdate ABC transporter permease subunit [Niallia sp. MER TA 168]CAI9388994.1 Molybdenum transport system permease protein ModB [Bacillus sp. T2.9-1]